MTKIGTPKTSSGMGDVLLLTAICKHIPNSTVELYPNAKKFQLFFDQICKEVIITDQAFVTPDIPPGHFAQQKLRFYGIRNKCYLPYVYPKNEYLTKGLELIKHYHNPIAFVANCAAHQKARDMPKNIAQNLVNNLISKNHTVLQFGLSNNLTELQGTTPIIDVSVYDLICYYSAIKKFVGVDTGDAHLMIALGGSCDLIIPSNKIIRNPEWWNYKNYNHITYVYF
jgi:hypothetical protein